MDNVKVVAYCRVSTDKDDQINSFISQKSYFTEYINKNDKWELINIYADEGISGTSTKKRQQFNQMIADAKNKKFNLILTKEVSRFARNTVDTLQYTRMLKELGVGVIFLSDNINTLDNDGELRLSIMATIAQEESRKTSERVKWGQKRRMEQGVVFGRNMLGYNVINGKLFINSEEAEVVRIIFNKYTNEKKGTFIIAKELQEAKILSKNNNDWSNTSILKILRNEKYVGDLCQKKTYTPNYLTHNKKYNNGHEDKVYIYDHHEAIISRDLWDRTQAELIKRSPNQEQKSKHSNRYWCSGKIECGECGSKFIGKTKTLKNGDTLKAWRCHEGAKHGYKKINEYGETVGCSVMSINEKTLRDCISFALSSIVDSKDEIINSLIKEIKLIQNTEYEDNTSNIESKINEINNKKKKIINLLIEGMISKEDMKLMNDEYDNEIEQLQNILLLSNQRNEIKESQINNIEKYTERIQELIFNNTNNNFEFLGEILEKVILFNENILEVYFKDFPFPLKLQYKTSGRLSTFDTQCSILNGAI